MVSLAKEVALSSLEVLLVKPVIIFFFVLFVNLKFNFVSSRVLPRTEQYGLCR